MTTVLKTVLMLSWCFKLVLWPPIILWPQIIFFSSLPLRRYQPLEANKLRRIAMNGMGTYNRWENQGRHGCATAIGHPRRPRIVVPPVYCSFDIEVSDTEIWRSTINIVIIYHIFCGHGGGWNSSTGRDVYFVLFGCEREDTGGRSFDIKESTSQVSLPSTA